MRPEVEKHIKILKAKSELCLRVALVYETFTKALHQLSYYYDFLAKLEEELDKILVVGEL